MAEAIRSQIQKLKQNTRRTRRQAHRIFHPTQTMKPNWLAVEIKEKRTGAVFCVNSSIPGTETWEFVHQATPMPLGFVWTRTVGRHTLEILHIYTLEEYRGCGIARRMIEANLRHYTEAKEVITGTLNRFSRGPFIKMGFKQHPELGHWFRRIERKS